MFCNIYDIHIFNKYENIDIKKISKLACIYVLNEYKYELDIKYIYTYSEQIQIQARYSQYPYFSILI